MFFFLTSLLHDRALAAMYVSNSVLVGPYPVTPANKLSHLPETALFLYLSRPNNAPTLSPSVCVMFQLLLSSLQLVFNTIVDVYV